VPLGTQTAPLREVLIVDDDADLCRALAEYLSHMGISSSCARDGLDALDQVRAGPPPCAIVLDLDMPRMSGPALVEALRSEPTPPRIPIITMTAADEPVGLDTEGHLPKPFAFEALLGRLFAICRSCAACNCGGPAVGSIYVARRTADRAGARS